MADTLTGRLFNQVDRTSQERGRRYFQHGAVSYIEGTPWAIHASVQGTRLYDVEVTTEKHHLNAFCTCAFFVQEQEPCKHVWAGLLSAERSGYVSGVAAIAAPHLRGVPVRAHAPELLEALRLPKRVTPPSWKQQLHSQRLQLEKAAERENNSNHNGRELIYAIDLAETQRSGYPLVEVHGRERRADGAWGKIKFKKFNAKDVSHIDDAVDRRVMTTLLGATETFDYGYSPATGQFMLTPAMWEIVLPLMCSTGRCTLKESLIGEDFTAIEWDDGTPWEFCLSIAPNENRKPYTVTGILRRGELEMALADPTALVAGGLVFVDGRIARLND